MEDVSYDGELSFFRYGICSGTIYSGGILRCLVCRVHWIGWGCMKKKINVWSFVCSITCIVLFFVPIQSEVFGFLRLELLLYLTVTTFFFGLIGFSGVKDWKGMARSVATVVLTLGLSGALMFVLFIGKLIGG